MPDLTAIEYGLLGIFLLLGLVLGWLARGGRSRQEKIAINAGWQEQLAAQRSEHERLVQQNKRLMEQISENQAAHKDSKMRAQELSDALKETFERRDELQRQLKDVRGKLDLAIAQRDKLRENIHSNADGVTDISNNIKEKDDKIFYLSRELQSWQDRVPPLVERFRIRDLEAQEIELELNKAKERIGELEGQLDSNQAHIESVGSDAIAGDLNASNDQYEETAEHSLSAPDEQHEAAVNGDQAAAIDATEAESVGETAMDAADNPQTDDLRLIRGVGPAIEKTLNSLGIFRFSQIAEMSEFDIDRVAQQLRGFRSRIYREDWVGQARSLEHQKNNDPG
ncbi:MAG: hypothetical protein IIB76_01470 [Proteobacteria bacterium]|nr:hypothetical protein [Pseudomonadota bacterium]